MQLLILQRIPQAGRCKEPRLRQQALGRHPPSRPVSRSISLSPRLSTCGTLKQCLPVQSVAGQCIAMPLLPTFVSLKFPACDSSALALKSSVRRLAKLHSMQSLAGH